MPYQPLYKAIFGTDFSGSSGYDDLQKISRQFPYFGAAHFFLLKKTPRDHPDFVNNAAKAALHFNNAHLLNLQLAKVLKTISEPVEESQAKVTEIVEPGTVARDLTTVQDKEIVVEQPAEDSLEIIFEPLHTTDYFASQGIKLSEEVQATDKLGKQLKSFTEWLKTMKKVHDSKLPAGSEQLDASVNKLAEKSNQEEDVVTEAMAEAFIQQGKMEKAKDIYLKLSLRNPSKNAYFAAKLEQIK